MSLSVPQSIGPGKQDTRGWSGDDQIPYRPVEGAFKLASNQK